MVYKIYKYFLKIVSSFELIIINILFFSIIFFYSDSTFAKVTSIERNLAYKYCDSIEKNLFKGLKNEKILKYEFFFNSINKKSITEEKQMLINLPVEVETICSYKIDNEEKEDLKKMIEIFISKNKK